VGAIYMEGKLVGIELPLSVVLTIKSTEPGSRAIRCRTCLNRRPLKQARSFRCLFFCNEGEKIRVDTRTGEYVERA